MASPRKSKSAPKKGGCKSRYSPTADNVNITVCPNGKISVTKPRIGHLELHQYYVENRFYHPGVMTRQQGRRELRELRTENDQALQDPCTATESVLEKFSEKELDRPVQERDLIAPAYALDDHTRIERLARKLSLDSAEVERIREDNGQKMSEVVYQMLLAWTRKKGNVTIRELVKVLCESKMDKCAIALKQSPAKKL